MKRRKFLKTLSLCGSSVFIFGCVPENMQQYSGMLTDIGEEFGVTPESLLRSASQKMVNGVDFQNQYAKQVFDTLNKKNNYEISANISELQKDWEIVEKYYADKQTLYPNDLLPVGKALVPILRATLRAEGAKVGLPKQYQANNSHYTSPITLASRRDFISFPYQLVSSKKEMLSVSQDKGIAIYPGQSITFEQKGYCLDPDRPAPKGGEQFALRPSKDLIAKPLQGIYDKLLEKSKTNPRIERNLQNIVWGLRTADSPSTSRADNLSSGELSIIEKAYPGAVKDFVKFRENHKSKVDFQERIIENLGQNVSQSYVNTASTKDLLNTITTAEPSGSFEQDSAYSTLDDGVVAHTVGTDTLQYRTTIKNVSDKPFYFDATQWVAESPRDVQRVAMLPPSDVRRSNFGLDYAEITSEQAKALKEQLVPQANDFLQKKRFKGLYIGDYIDTDKNLAMSTLCQGVKTGLELAPVTGTILSAVEAVTGRDWITGEQMGTADRLLSCMGVIPGVKAVQKIIGVAKLPKIAGWAVKNAKVSSMVNFADRTKGGQALVDWALSDPAEMTVEKIRSSPYGRAVVETLQNGANDLPQSLRSTTYSMGI